jgi:hypothetical protein
MTMTEVPRLIERDELKKIIDGLCLDEEKKHNEYIKARWLKYVLWWDYRSRDASRKYHLLRGTVIIAGALLPALVGLRELSVFSQWNWLFSIAAIIASLVVAICAGIESLFEYGQVWREKRAAGEQIKIEGFRFFQLTGDYNHPPKTHADLYPLFAARVEEMIEREIKDYFIAVKPVKEEK